MVPRIVKGFFRLMENVLKMVLYRIFLKRVLSSTQMGSSIGIMVSSIGVKLVTIAEPFWVLYRTIYNTFSSNQKKEPFNHAKGFLSVHSSI